MNVLPKWLLANPFPAIHDFESLTVLEQTARLYGAVNGLITEYNNTVEKLETYMKQETASREDFELKITKVMNEFMCSLEEHLTDLNVVAAEIVTKAIEAGEITIQLTYDPDKESLDMAVGGEV